MSQSEGILAGLKVVEMATYIFAPASATLLSDYGAQVIKIEKPPEGDTYRKLSANIPMPKAEINYCWVLDGRNRRSAAIDVGTPEGREVLLKLVRDADIFITNYRPDILAKLRLSYDDLEQINERLIYAHATGFGETSEEANYPGFDQTAYWARSGLMFSVHNADADPCPSVAGMGDHPSAMTLFAGILLALRNRDTTGKGTKVSSSLMANGFWSNACMIQAAIVDAQFYTRRKRTTTFNPLVNHYVTSCGQRFIFCMIHPDRDWQNLCKAIELEHLIEDPRFSTRDARQENSSVLVELIDAAVCKKSMDQWRPIFAAHKVIWGPVLSVQQIAQDPYYLEHGFFTEIDDPRHGKMRVVDTPITIRGVEKAKPTAAPDFGQHTREVLSELGYDNAAIDRMLQAGSAAG